MMKNILVTGGAGFIGSNFIHYWLGRHAQSRVINLDVLSYAGNLESLKAIEDSPRYRFVKGDICDSEVVEKIFTEENIDTVVHFAAESHVDRSITGPEAFIKTNVFGTFNLLEAARKFWQAPSDKRFLHVSTDEVYGTLEPTDPSFTETTAFAPNSPYSASKASSDHLVRAYYHTYGLPVVTTNCSNNYGPYQFPEKLIPLIFTNAIESKPLPVYGDGSNIRDWLYVEDHCSGIEAVLERGRLGETYNIGGCNEWKNIDIVHIICDYLDKVEPAEQPRRNLVTYIKDRPGHDQRYAIDATKMLNELGWKPVHNFEEGIIKTINWYRTNSEWLERVRGGSYQDYYREQYTGR